LREQKTTAKSPAASSRVRSTKEKAPSKRRTHILKGFQMSVFFPALSSSFIKDVDLFFFISTEHCLAGDADI
jgi:hypothetical protein